MLSAARFVPAKIVGGEDAPSPIPCQVSVQHKNVNFFYSTNLDKMTIITADSHFY